MARQAPLTANDVRVIFDEKMKPFLDRQEQDHEQIRTNTQTLSGSDGRGGVKHVLELHGESIESAQKTHEADMSIIMGMVNKSKGAIWIVVVVGIPAISFITHYVLSIVYKIHF